MAIEKVVEDDKIEVVSADGWKVVQVRTATILKEDGVELNRSFSRRAILPVADWSGESAELKAICDAVHNNTTKAAYEAAQAPE